jgi:hypothetical protein
LAADFSDNITQPRLWVDNDHPAFGVGVATPIARLSSARNDRKALSPEPTGKIELLSMLTVRMDMDQLCRLGSQQVHRVCDHYRSFV